MDRTVTAVLVAAIMAMSCCVLLVSDEGDAAETKQVGTYQDLLSTIQGATEGLTIQLTADIEVDAMLNIKDKESITLDLNNHKITSSENFKGSDDVNYNDKHLVNVERSKLITIENGVLETTASNKHVLNVYEDSTVTLNNITLDHTNAIKGAPLVVNGSKVSLEGKNTFITGNSSWYAVNIDNKKGTDGAGVETAVSTELYFEGASPLGFIFDKNGTGTITIEFGLGTTATSDKNDFILSAPNVGVDMEGITVNDSAVKIILENQIEPTPTPGYDDDEDLPPYIPSQSSNDDDTVTIVACAAAAAVAAILAVFLVIDRK